MKLKNIGIFVVFLLLSVFIMFPQFLVQSPGIVDDGTDFLFVKNNSYSQIIYNQLLANERTQPLRFIYKKVLYQIFKLDMPSHFFANAMILTISCYLLYLILENITSKKKIAFIGVIFFILSTPVVATFYRLGTNEPLQLLLVLLGIYSWLQGRLFLTVFLFTLNLFVKETSLLLYLVPLILLLINKKWKVAFINFIVFTLFGGLLIYKYLTPASEYIHQASFSWNLIRGNLKYAWIYLIAMFLVLPKLFWDITKHTKDRDFKIMVGGLILASSLPLTFWFMNQYYYYLVIIGLLVIAFGYVINHLPNKLLFSILNILLFFSFVNFILFAVPVARLLHRKAIRDGALSEYLLNNDFTHTHVFSNVVGFEGNHKIYTYTNEWSAKSKDFSPPINLWLATLGDKDNSRRKILTQKALNSFVNSQESSKILISDIKIKINGFSLEPVCGYSVIIGTSCKYYVYKPVSQL